MTFEWSNVVPPLVGVGAGSLLTYYAGEVRRLRIGPLGPTAKALDDGSILFLYEFRVVVGRRPLPNFRSAATSVGGRVRLSAADGEVKYGADALWDGVPPAGVVNIYGDDR